MSREPKHTPEQLAKDATADIQQAVPDLGFNHLSDIQNVLVKHFGLALPRRKRSPKPPAVDRGMKP